MEQDSPNESVMKAIRKGDCESVKLLLENGADVTYGGYWLSTLAVASSWGHQEIVQLLLDKGAVVNIVTMGIAGHLLWLHLGTIKALSSYY
jgi:ankyrin repeat protein